MAKRADKERFDVYMMTPDKDYGQLTEPHVFIYKPRYGGNDFELLDERKVTEKYGLSHPSQVIDLLGLMGDASDNIPGCPGVGEKTAVKLLQEFGSIENLLEHTDRLKGALRKKVEENSEQIRVSRMLATIKTDVPIEVEEETLTRGEKNEEAIRKIFEELEFRNLLSRVLKEDTLHPFSAQPVQGELFPQFEAAETKETAALPTRFTDISNTSHDYRMIATEQTESRACNTAVRSERGMLRHRDHRCGSAPERAGRSLLCFP